MHDSSFFRAFGGGNSEGKQAGIYPDADVDAFMKVDWLHLLFLDQIPHFQVHFSISNFFLVETN